MKTNLSNPVKLILLLAALMLAGELINAQAISNSANTNLALNKTATASSLESVGYPASNAVDANQNTRFSSGFSDNEWISIDLGKASLIKTVVLTWERAYGTDFNILFSNNGSYTDLYADSIQVRNNVLTNNDVAGTNTINAKTNTIARYVRMQGIHRSTGYGYSLWDMQVMGTQSFSSALLPVTLTGLAVTRQANANVVSWTTLVEINNAGFSIERSDDGSHFASIAWIAGKNRSAVAVSYSYADKQSAAGKTTYYRLKQVDLDGQAAYSAVLSVTNSSPNTNIKAYPVPVTDHLVIEYKSAVVEKITVALYNAAGQPVYNREVNVTAGAQNIIVGRTSAMHAGVYILKINAADHVYTQPLMME